MQVSRCEKKTFFAVFSLQTGLKSNILHFPVIYSLHIRGVKAFNSRNVFRENFAFIKLDELHSRRSPIQHKSCWIVLSIIIKHH